MRHAGRWRSCKTVRQWQSTTASSTPSTIRTPGGRFSERPTKPAAKVQQNAAVCVCVRGPRSGTRPGTSGQRAGERNASAPVGVRGEGVGRVWRCARCSPLPPQCEKQQHCWPNHKTRSTCDRSAPSRKRISRCSLPPICFVSFPTEVRLCRRYDCRRASWRPRRPLVETRRETRRRFAASHRGGFSKRKPDSFRVYARCRRRTSVGRVPLTNASGRRSRWPRL